MARVEAIFQELDQLVIRTEELQTRYPEGSIITPNDQKEIDSITERMLPLNEELQGLLQWLRGPFGTDLN